MGRLRAGILLLGPAILGQRLARQDERLCLRAPMRDGLLIQPLLLSRGMARSPGGKPIPRGIWPFKTSTPVAAAGIASGAVAVAVVAQSTVARLIQAVLKALLLWSRNFVKLLAGILRRRTSGLRLASSTPSPSPSPASTPAPADLAPCDSRLLGETFPGLLSFQPLRRLIASRSHAFILFGIRVRAGRPSPGAGL